MTLYHNCIISHTKFPTNKLYHDWPKCHLVPISMFWSSMTNSWHSLNPTKHSLLMTRQHCFSLWRTSFNNATMVTIALYSTLALLWWSKTYFYPTSFSLASNITILWLRPRLGLTRTSPVSTELVDRGKAGAFGNVLAKSLPINWPQLNCWLVSWTFLWLGFSYVPLPPWFYLRYSRAFFMTTSVNCRKCLVMYAVDTKTRSVDNMCWSTFHHLR